MKIAGCVALVTGTNRGIGRQIVEELCARGASRVYAAMRDLAGAHALPPAAEPLRLDITVADTVARVASEHPDVTLLVNNAGVGQFASVEETDDQTWDDVIGTNLTAVFRLTRAAIPHLARRGGQIVMISSLAGQNPIAGMATYCASKAALDHFTACLMLEVRPKGIRVTTIAPGSVDTSFGAMPRSDDSSWKLSSEDVARTLVDVVGLRDGAHTSRVEMRPARPQKR